MKRLWGLLRGRAEGGNQNTDKLASTSVARTPVPLRSAAHTITPHKDNEVTIGHTDDLPDFARKLYEVVDLQPSLRHLLCPVEVDNGKFAIILLDEMLRSDIADEVIKRLSFKFAKANPFYYVATKSVLVELCRDALTENRKKVNSSGTSLIRKEGSALWAMFESAAIFAMKNDASDLHFEIERNKPQSQIRFRVDGRMTSPREFHVGTMEMLDTVAYLYNVHSKSGSENTYNENKPQQCQIQASINGRQMLFRWASNQTATGTKVVMRMLYQDEAQTIRPLTDLGYMPGQIEIWKRAIACLGGGTVVSGVVGSGKSTTMQTVMSMIPDWMAKYTVEDPVEYIMPNTSQFSVSRTMSEQGNDPFLAVKRQLKRMDPDVVLIGEIRDEESAGLFRDVAESGHRAFATVHAPSAIDMITLRLTSEELGIPRDVIATPGFLNLLVYQALIPKVCSHCKLPASEVMDPAYLEKIKRLFDIDPLKMTARNIDGCEHCRREGLPELNGSKGRLVVAEMIELDTKMLILFRDQKNLELKEYIRSRRVARFDDPDSTGKTVLEVAMYRVSQGLVDPREVEAKFGSFDQYDRDRLFNTDQGAVIQKTGVVSLRSTG